MNQYLVERVAQAIAGVLVNPGQVPMTTALARAAIGEVRDYLDRLHTDGRGDMWDACACLDEVLEA